MKAGSEAYWRPLLLTTSIHYQKMSVDNSELDIKQFHLKEMIKTLERISLDLKKLTVESNLLLCELNLECSQPEETMKLEEKPVVKKKPK